MRMVVDASPTCPRAAIVDGCPPRALRTDEWGPALAALAPAVVIHRLIHAPEGCGETAVAPAADDLRQAGVVEPRETAARVDAYEAACGWWPGARHLAVFDDAWFRGLPAAAATEALPPEVVAQYGLRRRGRHGPVHRLAAADCAVSRVVSVVLGGASSVAAVVDGQPVDISAGATALAGVPGEVTCGDMDPAAVLYLVEPLGLTIDEAEQAIAVTGGLSGVRTGHADGEELAQRLRLHRVKRAVGAAVAVMGGVDALVLSSNCGPVPEPLLAGLAAGLSYLGLGDRVPLTTSAWTSCTAAAALVA